MHHGEKKKDGVNCAIDAAGYQAISKDADPDKAKIRCRPFDRSRFLLIRQTRLVL